MVTSKIVIALVLAPRNTQAGDHGAGIHFVLVSQQEVYTAGKQQGVVGRNFVQQRQAFGGAMPLVEKGVEAGLEWYRKRLGHLGGGIVASVAEAYAQGEFGTAGEIEFSSQGDVAIERAIVLPSHFEMVEKVGPAIVDSHVSTGKLDERKGETGDDKIDIVPISH